MAILRQGSRGAAVREVQELLNRRLGGGTRLTPDGEFGARTRAAVLRFQQESWLIADGEVGPCTLNALKGSERYAYLHRVRLVPQWTQTTCWSAATAMLTGQQACMAAGPATATQEVGLLNDSELDDPANMRRFAAYHRLTLVPGATWLPDGLANFLSRGPIMINTLWDVAGYASRAGSPGHMRVVAGIRGDGTPQATTLRIYDPWPPMRGTIASYNYARLIRATPLTTYQILHR